jgi:hypothetical protein
LGKEVSPSDNEKFTVYIDTLLLKVNKRDPERVPDTEELVDLLESLVYDESEGDEVDIRSRSFN